MKMVRIAAIKEYGNGARFHTLRPLVCPYCQHYANQHYSTIVENVLQIDLFLQNKAKLCNTKINVSSFVTSE